MGIFAGVDWGSATHAVCVINSSGESLAHFEVKHDEGGLSELIKRLRKLSPREALRIALEYPHALAGKTQASPLTFEASGLEWYPAHGSPGSSTHTPAQFYAMGGNTLLGVVGTD